MFNDEGNKAHGYACLHCKLCVGDLNGDGVDDLAVLSSVDLSDQTDKNHTYDYLCQVPYLTIGCGEKGGYNFLGKGPTRKALKHMND